MHANIEFSIEQYKKKKLVQEARKRNGYKKKITEYKSIQKNYLAICVEKNINPDHKLLQALCDEKYILKLDRFGRDELYTHMGLLKKYSSLRCINLSLGSVDIKRDLRNKLELLGLEKAFAYSSLGSSAILKAVALCTFKSSNLLQLQLNGVPISEPQSWILAKALVNSNSLEYINLASSNLSDAGLKALFPIIGQLPRVSYVSLSACNLTDEACHYIAKIISMHGALKDEQAWSSSLRAKKSTVRSQYKGTLLLDISMNSLGDKSAQVISNALYHDHWLLGLNINQNCFSKDGVSHFVETLESNTTLSILTLSGMGGTSSVISLRSIENELKNRCSYLRELAAQSHEKKDYFRSIMGEWGVAKDYVIEVCGIEKEVTTSKTPKAREICTFSANSNTFIPEVSAYHHQKNQRKEYHVRNNTDMSVLAKRLRSLELAQKQSEVYILKIENENKKLKNKLLLCSTPTITPAESSIIQQLENSITVLAKQVELLENNATII